MKTYRLEYEDKEGNRKVTYVQGNNPDLLVKEFESEEDVKVVNVTSETE